MDFTNHAALQRIIKIKSNPTILKKVDGHLKVVIIFLDDVLLSLIF